MEEQIKLIAERIKGLRDIYGVTMEDLARELNVPLDVYQGYENGTADIPVSVLYGIAHRFGLELAALLTGEEPRLHTYALTRRGRGVSVERRKEYQYQSLAAIFAQKKMEPFMVTVAPHDPELPVSLNSHAGQEFNYVLEGSLQVVLGKNEIVLNEGDCLYFDSAVAHGMRALNGKTARFLAIII